MAPQGVKTRILRYQKQLHVALAARLGLSIAGALAYYMVLVIVLMLVFMALVLYPLAIIGGRLSLARFVKGSAPAQSVGFSSRSSLACLLRRSRPKMTPSVALLER